MTAELKKYFDLSPKDRREIISLAATETGGEEKILEKDVMVVWILDTVFRSPFGDALSFKGGTSLSKVYQLINRFSEDVDLTYDIRKFLPGMAYDHDGIPPSNSQQRKLTAAVREKLPAWIEGELARLLTKAISDQGLSATLRQNTAETLNIDYPSLFEGHTYVRPSVLLEFGARSTGEPTSNRCGGRQ
ncbi:nucleotidyl transferase AbiEii/AbiGii toxin family protein (plasmid) [Phyllobacterium sp. A18/5-2]|uniref:nucleotidyl transferase AbiEii/AbiGii toxin family protein n=1 Tax=Phyllobacterium sp. A18/5-2 TaxID=2978392 RepID=UPI0021CA02C6|nr:nucleotidyl transferase AbiEii/AbiGii toxin family protein [Phyllobacterium sp. A18/5-2]UXN67064.1 nucleotidyl transferase AbiEii/AbiGii toxin family protein [Phyllobacterium sp. A18/5-2]